MERNIVVLMGGFPVLLEGSWEVLQVLVDLEHACWAISSEMENTGFEVNGIPARVTPEHWLFALEGEAQFNEDSAAGFLARTGTVEKDRVAFAATLRAACEKLRALGIQAIEPLGNRVVEPQKREPGVIRGHTGGSPKNSPRTMKTDCHCGREEGR